MNPKKIMCNITDMCTRVDNKPKEMCSIVTDKAIADAEVGKGLMEQTTDCTNAREMVTTVGNAIPDAKVHQYLAEQIRSSKRTETTNPRQQAEPVISQPRFVDRTIESVYGMNPYINIMHAQLMVVAELVFKKYAIETNQLSFEQAEQLLIKFNTYVQDAIYYNNRALIEKSPIVTLCQAIITKITENRFPVVPRNAQIDDARHYILEDAERWYIRQGDILTMKNEYEAENGIKRIEVTATRLAKDLCDNEIAMPCDEGKTHRYAKKIGKHRYVVIDKMKLNQVANL